MRADAGMQPDATPLFLAEDRVVDQETEAGSAAEPLQPANSPPDPPLPTLQAYVHDAAHVADAVALFDRAFADGDEWSTASAVRAGATDTGWDPDGPVARALELTALFRLKVPHGERAAVGCTLGPQWEAEDAAYPARISEVPDSVVELWRDLAKLCTAPAARARAHDLLFERRDGDVGRHASAAIDSYFDVVRSTPVDLTSAAAALRAWELSRRTADWARHAVAQELLLRSCESGLSADESMPGVVLPMLRAALEPPRKKQPATATDVPPEVPSPDALLERAAALYPQGFLVREVFELLRGRTTDPEALATLARREAQAHLDEAAAAPDGFVRQARLVEAIAVARDRGLPDLVDAATRQLQQIPPSSLQMKPIRSSVSIPAVPIEQYLAPFTRGQTWRDPLAYFLLTGPPTGKYAWLEEQERDLAKISIVRRLLTTVRIMEGGLPKASVAPDGEDARQMEIARIAGTTAGLQGDLLATGLRRLVDEYDIPDVDDVAVFLGELGAADPGLRFNLAEALRLFWEGRYDACVHVIVPRIETAARSLLRECDVATFRTQVGASLGGYVGLQPLLAALRENHLDEDWGYFLRWLLLDPGLNLRNDVAHGLVGRTSAWTAALALRAAGLLILLAGHPADLDWDPRQDGRKAEASSVVPLEPRRVREQLHALLSDPVPGQVVLPVRGVVAATVVGAVGGFLRRVASSVTWLADRTAPATEASSDVDCPSA